MFKDLTRSIINNKETRFNCLNEMGIRLRNTLTMFRLTTCLFQCPKLQLKSLN